jgi:hypothetical protein
LKILSWCSVIPDFLYVEKQRDLTPFCPTGNRKKSIMPCEKSMGQRLTTIHGQTSVGGDRLWAPKSKLFGFGCI